MVADHLLPVAADHLLSLWSSWIPTATAIIISHIHFIVVVIVIIVVVIVLFCVSFSPLSPLLLPLSTQPVKADGRPPRVRFCSSFLPIKREFFLAVVAKRLLMGECWVSVN